MRSLRLIGIVAAAVFAAGVPAHAQLTTSARHAILMDYDTGETLFAQDADAPMAPSSMSKLMTAELVFKGLKEGSLKLTDTLHVSRNAWLATRSRHQSRMFVERDGDVSVDDLLKGVIVDSGNDACIVLAEGLGGTTEAFAAMMTRRAQELGLASSHFANPTGMPDEGQYMSARDLAALAAHILRTYPDYRGYFNMPSFSYNGRDQENHNPLLAMNIGADGMKTGYTDAGGYGLVATALQEGRRLILVVNGLESKRSRADESARLLEVGFREFKRYDLFREYDLVAEARVWGGEKATLPVMVREPLAFTLPADQRPDFKLTLQYRAPIPAPVAAGQEVGTLIVSAPDKRSKKIPVYAAAVVRATDVVGHIVIGAEALIEEQRARLRR
jgi:D-alanyl-D-alanine carboxypeptidase (penicillin-binding protein 5/6)